MSKVIYLDLDGVMFCAAEWHIPDHRIRTLNDLAHDSAAEIVVSSSYRLSGPQKILPHLAGVGIAHLAGCTPPEIEDKAEAILADWKARGCPPMVVIDDRELTVPNLIRCNPRFGLTKAVAREAKRSLNHNVDLHSAYCLTTFNASGADNLFVEIRIGELSPELDRILDSLDAPTWAFITAFNPQSVELTRIKNERRNHQLEADLTEHGWAYWAGQGIPANEDWEPEDSFLIFGISRAEALSLARKWEQNAFVFGEHGHLPELIWCAKPSEFSKTVLRLERTDPGTLP